MLIGEIFSEGGLIAVVIVAVLLFGGAAIPKLARNLGSAKTEFEKGLKAGKGADDAAAASDADKKPDADQ